MLKYFKNKKIGSKILRKTYFLLYLILFLCILFSILGVLAAGTYFSIARTLPEPTLAAMISRPASSRLFDRDGQLLYEVHGDVKRRFIPLAEIPLFLQQATIAIEDKNFYEHHGFDLLAIARAFYKNHQKQAIRQGASTITQQLARTVFLARDRTYLRKIKELIMARRIEKLYSKNQILEMYLNNIPYGSNAYGVAAASEIYYNKAVSQLDSVECAYLAALPKAPSEYSPFGPNQAALQARADLVIQAMYENGFLLDFERSFYLREGKPSFIRAPVPIRAPHFVFYVLSELEKTYGRDIIREGGFDIYTSLDLGLQEAAEKIIAERGRENEEKYQADNAALVALDPKTGQILAMVGSRDYFSKPAGAFNAATGLRQPGSSFKPYVYAAAIADGLTPNSILIDSRTNFASANSGVDYIPQNYTKRHYGAVTVRQALAGSLNVPAVKVLVKVGIDKVIGQAEKLGISTLGERQRFGPALALGGAEVKLLEHTAGLAALGNEGVKQPLSPILKIISPDKKVIFAWEKNAGVQAVDPQAAYWINNILSDNLARQFIFGWGRMFRFSDRPVAAKTGTSQDFRDAWTLGYTPNIAAGVWVGNTDNRPMKDGADGSVVAAPIWHDFMAKAFERFPEEEFRRPADLIDPPPPKFPVKMAGKKASSTDEDVSGESKADKPVLSLK